MTVTATSTPPTSEGLGLGGEVFRYPWTWQDQSVEVVWESLGQGDPILLLPALSTVSTRGEMRPLAECLAAHYQTIALDWPGFGESSRLPLDYKSALYCQVLQDFVRNTFKQPIPVVAAGHAAGYAMSSAGLHPPIWSQIILAAPTWRGPFPTMTGGRKWWHALIRETVRSPLLGQALYAQLTKPNFLATQYRQHVYADADRITPSLIAQKRQTTQQPNARFASAAFVTGRLDPAGDRAECLAWFDRTSVPVSIVIGERTPPKSKAQMEAIAARSEVRSHHLPGSLALHEEYAAELAEVVRSCLENRSSSVE